MSKQHRVVVDFVKARDQPGRARLRLPANAFDVVTAVRVLAYRFEGLLPVTTASDGPHVAAKESYFMLRFGHNVNEPYRMWADDFEDTGMPLPLTGAVGSTASPVTQVTVDATVEADVLQRVFVNGDTRFGTVDVFIDAPPPPSLPTGFSYDTTPGAAIVPAGVTYLPPNDGTSYLGRTAQFTRCTIHLLLTTAPRD